MAVPTAITDLSATLASNPPAGGDQAFPYVDDYLRAAYGLIRQGDAKASDIASAASVDLGAAAGRIVDVTGTTTITSFGTVAAGIWRIVRFTGALTLTHNATSLILPGGANLKTTAGDSLIAVSLGSGNWVVPLYQPSAKTFSANGYIKLSGGLYVQWGSVASVDPSTPQSVTFPVAFPNACATVNLTVTASSTGNYGAAIASSVSVSGFTARLYNDGANAATLYWIALGY